MVAAIGDGTAFSQGRDFAAWLGLVPKQMSTGDRARRPRHSAQASTLGKTQLRLQRPRIACTTNVLATALANKLARIA